VSSISERRCFNHARREAVARCPACGNFFCRECITEHEGRMTCARCLLEDQAPRRSRRFLSVVLRGFQLLAGVLVLWLAFFLMGRGLLKIPSSFHDGTFWSAPGADR
jgi:hypothetical protein